MNPLGENPPQVPAMSGLTLPELPVSRSEPRQRVAGAGFAALAGMLVLVSSFLPLFTAERSGIGIRVIITSWGIEFESDDAEAAGQMTGSVAVSGYVLVASAILLLGTAILCTMSATAAASRGMPRASGLTGMAAMAFLAGAVSVIGTEVANYVQGFRRTAENLGDLAEIGIDARPAAGLWLLVGAVALAVAAVVAVLRSTREPSAQERAAELQANLQADLDTPRYGFPLPVTQPGQERLVLPPMREVNAWGQTQPDPQPDSQPDPQVPPPQTQPEPSPWAKPSPQPGAGPTPEREPQGRAE